ncbi:MAG: NADH-quinone oxidoreductase subunit C [Myxococcales bacterium]|nr:NADH-quinone oxidoreductase subunit C [Myxococcales bacterium]
MSIEVVEYICEQKPELVVRTESAHRDETVVIRAPDVDNFMTFVRRDTSTSFEMLMDITSVDHGEQRSPRFEVVYHLYSLTKNHRLRVKVPLEEQALRLSTVSHIWHAATWMEREVFDLYGVVFQGNPDLRRLLMFSDFEGHPLRKDYPLEGR